MIIKGFRFGILLQVAIGPICIFLFQTAMTSGFIVALVGVLDITLVETPYIILAILEIGILIKNIQNLNVQFPILADWF